MTRQRTNEAYAERTHDECRWLDLHGWSLLRGRLDLAAFQAMSADERRAAWLSASDDDKLGLALQVLRHYGHELTSDAALAYVETMEARFGPSLTERAVEAALERLAEENARSARTARRANEADDARFFQRAANSYLRALEQWRSGVRPERTEAGNWRLPSRTDGQPHLLTMDGDWVCSCKAGSSMHWAKALIIGLEAATEDQDRFDNGDEGVAGIEPPPAPTFVVTIYEQRTVTLSDRIARARQLIADNR